MLHKVFIPIVAFGYSCSSFGDLYAGQGATASFTYEFNGESEKTLLEVVQDIEKGQGEKFMHVKGMSSIKISFSYEAQPDNWLASARSVSFFGKPVYCEIKVDPMVKPGSKFRYGNKEDLRAVLRHEIGHCFGLKHNEYKMSVMYWQYDGVNYRDLGAIQAYDLDLYEARSK